MPRTVPCAKCGQPCWHGKGSRPAGQAMCRQCCDSTPKRRQAVCVQCSALFDTYKPAQRFCTLSCWHAYPKAPRPRRPRKPRPKRDTSGYGAAHQAQRRLLLPLAMFTDCPLCGDPMLPEQALDLDHSTPLNVAVSGSGDRITHASCNRSSSVCAGKAPRPWRSVERDCVVCGTSYWPDDRDQRACGRACGWELQRRNQPAPKPPRPPRQPKPTTPRYTRTCPVCSVSFETGYPRQRFCSRDCRCQPQPTRTCEVCCSPLQRPAIRYCDDCVAIQAKAVRRGQRKRWRQNRSPEKKREDARRQYRNRRARERSEARLLPGPPPIA